MTKGLTLRISVTAFSFALFMFAGSMTVSAQTCDTTTDAQLVTTVLAKFAANKNLSKQLQHINVESKAGVIILKGWTDSTADWDKAVVLVSEVKCVAVINANGLEYTPPPLDSPLRAGNCAPGTKVCGDVCIPDSDVCNIKTQP